MKRLLAIAFVAAVCALPVRSVAQGRGLEKLDIGNIPKIDDNSPTMWGLSGWDIFKVYKGDNGKTPIMRTETADARTVEIFARTQAPPIRKDGSDVRAVSAGGRTYVVVRRYILMEVTPQDARAENTSTSGLAQRWARSAGRILPRVCPINQYGL